MALAKKCDRCGTYFDVYKMHIKRQGRQITTEGLIKIKGVSLKDIEMDLCEECMEKLLAFLVIFVEDVDHVYKRQCDKCIHKIGTKPGIEACDVLECEYEPKSDKDPEV